jgi:glutamine amidotransferase
MIVIVDYGVGNVGSILNMLRVNRTRARLSADPAEIEAADKLILPGVGNFGHGMEKLAATGLIPILERHALERGKPLLGICLGMQMMTRGSEESPVPGLGWVKGSTHKFSEAGLRVPHMGWNAVRPVAGARLFDSAPEKPERFYFVHSYCVRTDDPSAMAAGCLYGREFVASFEVGNLFGVQFHPEKSQGFGKALLKRFAAL